MRHVELLPGVESRSRDQVLHLARTYPVDRVLAVFRANAGLDTRGAEPPGAWEDHGHPDERAWNEADYPGVESASTANLLRGHYAGHFLSTLALSHAVTGEEVFRSRAHEVVAGLAEVQAALAATGRFSHPGFLAAYGEWQFSRLEELAPYGEIWAPYYTCHKVLAGLLDAHEHTGSEQALDVAVAVARWVSARIARLDRAHLQRMWSLYIAGEFGGMGESLVKLHRVTGDESLLDAAAAFEVDRVLEAALDGRDVLDGLHANQHLPMLVAHLEQYEVTGDVRYLDAVRVLWDQLVPGRTFAHGGTGEGELWGPPGTVAGFIGRRNAESCATYNLLKIARYLFEHTLDVRYADYLERAALNHITGSRADVDSDTSPEVLYMFPVDPGALREYGNVGTCCGGTGLESHVKQTEAVWFASAGEGTPVLHLARYVPSRLTVPELGGTLTLATRYPREGAVSVRCDLEGELELRLRIPEWARGTSSWRLRVCGADAADPAEQDGFAVVRRTFARGDVVDVDFALPVRLEPTPDDPAVVNLQRGPSVLLARDDRTTMLEVAPAGHRLLDGTIDHVALPDGGVSALGLTFEPAWSGGSARHHTYLRAVDTVIAFHGSPTSVPNRRGQDGWSFLGALWGHAPFASFTEFARAVHAEAVRAVSTGLLSTAEAGDVLAAAAASTLDSPPAPRTSAGVGALAGWGPLPAGVVAAPAVRVRVLGERSPSGWYTTTPSIVAQVEPDAASEVSVDGGAWALAGAPLEVADGVHHVRARALGPASTAPVAEARVAVDTRPPAVDVRVRPLGATGVQVTVEAQDETSGVDRIHWRTPETFWAVYQEPFTRQLREDEQVLEVIASDRAGNVTRTHRVVLPPAGP
ncbi:glycoside hydrolase family 127 protein [Kineococcus sp. TRM81007]|uniref:beta-L-arabinofuranosidase domain-containing protein n=1 Tax=Kineococcus sp. TRM81007 TaxID=2925831 RepID=UPI001F560933|nr:beta-L-arabinofuranosidase domain-containing protein [Kineococcus sp. TRM81007]MCI2239564.1 glycoside hydrolase family 127 protein [Kineococcus sp. TRM81007]